MPAVLLRGGEPKLALLRTGQINYSRRGQVAVRDGKYAPAPATKAAR